MKVQLDTKILNLQGEPIKDGDGDLTLKAVICAAMLGLLQEDQNADSTAKVRMFRLAQRAVDGGEQDISAEDITLIKQRVGKMYGALIVGRAFDLLEGVN